jgi:hypothetical protein
MFLALQTSTRNVQEGVTLWTKRQERITSKEKASDIINKTERKKVEIFPKNFVLFTIYILINLNTNIN